jgi:hypothetical protein
VLVLRNLCDLLPNAIHQITTTETVILRIHKNQSHVRTTRMKDISIDSAISIDTEEEDLILQEEEDRYLKEIWSQQQIHQSYYSSSSEVTSDNGDDNEEEEEDLMAAEKEMHNV